MNQTTRHLAVLSLIGVTLVAGATSAEAQIRYPGPYGGPYPYPGYRVAGPEAQVKIKVGPDAVKNAAVYVDGYFAGVVDEFDGAFQSLRVVPGQHEIVVYLEGFRSIREKLYLGPNMSRKIEGTMEPLAPGEPNEPKPEPPSPSPQPPAPSP
jgi:hypothetical protein